MSSRKMKDREKVAQRHAAVAKRAEAWVQVRHQMAPDILAYGEQLRSQKLSNHTHSFVMLSTGMTCTTCGAPPNSSPDFPPD